MAQLWITNAANDVLRKWSRNGLDESESVPESGGVLITIDKETLDRLSDHRFPGETYSDVIIRLDALHAEHGFN